MDSLLISICSVMWTDSANSFMESVVTLEGLGVLLRLCCFLWPANAMEKCHSQRIL